MVDLIEFGDFTKVEMRIGTIISAEINKKARKPAYSMRIDFGNEVGIKSTSAQITKEHSLEDLINTQVIAVTNFSPKKVADIISEVLVLAVVEGTGRTVLLGPIKSVSNGSRVL